MPKQTYKQNAPQRDPGSSLTRPAKKNAKARHAELRTRTLNRAIGNLAVQALSQGHNQSTIAGSLLRTSATPGYALTGMPVCRKPVSSSETLTMNAQGDIYEREADQASENVMRKQRSSQPAQRFGVPHNAETAQISNSHTSSNGEPLYPETRQFFESRLGHNFANVRVHTDQDANESARRLDARAYTMGNDITFAAGQYRPGTGDGKRLLAHELMHVVQQRRSTRPPMIQRWQWPWSPPPPRVIVSVEEPAEERPLPLPELTGEGPTPEESRQIAEFRELARFPLRAHRLWPSLNATQRAGVFGEMLRQYGPDFAQEFMRYANAGHFDATYEYTNHYRATEGGVRVPLTAQTYIATDAGYAFAGAGVAVGLLYDHELWVHPSGRSIEFTPPRRTPEPARPGLREPETPGAMEEESPIISEPGQPVARGTERLRVSEPEQPAVRRTERPAVRALETPQGAEEETETEHTGCEHIDQQTLGTWYENWREAHGLIHGAQEGEQESPRVTLQSNDGTIYEVLRVRTLARDFRPGGLPRYELYFWYLRNEETGRELTYNICQIADNFNPNLGVD